MPNWCYTDIDIYGEKEKVEFLHKKLEEWTSKNALENSFGTNWLGNILINSGVISADQLDKVPHPSCRGSLIYLDLDTNIEPAALYVQTETAWGPMLQMWIEVLQKYNLDLEIVYKAVETGCEIYFTNDPCMQGKYIIDLFEQVDGAESDWEATEEEVKETLHKLLKTDDEDFEKLLQQFYDSELCEKMSINPWEYVPLEELD